MQVRERDDDKRFSLNTVNHSARKARQQATTQPWSNFRASHRVGGSAPHGAV